jgi:hypothetical protein
VTRTRFSARTGRHHHRDGPRRTDAGRTTPDARSWLTGGSRRARERLAAVGPSQQRRRKLAGLWGGPDAVRSWSAVTRSPLGGGPPSQPPACASARAALSSLAPPTSLAEITIGAHPGVDLRGGSSCRRHRSRNEICRAPSRGTWRRQPAAEARAGWTRRRRERCRCSR